MLENRLQLIGLCRFSYPTAKGSGFLAKSSVYDLDRLRSRLDIFRRLWLPSICGQTDRRVQVVILIGDGLPAEIRHELYELVSAHSLIHIHSEPDGQAHSDVCRKVLQRYRDPAAEFVGEFALDDDDALALDFAAQARDHFPSIQPLLNKYARAELDFSRGFAVSIDGKSCQLKEVVAPHWNCGQIIFQRLPSRLSLFNFHHFRFWKKHPCLLLAQQPMFVRSFHSSNDSGDRWAKVKAESKLDTAPEAISTLGERFGIELQCGADGSLMFRQ